jgi:hypothetical protein
MRMWWHKMGKLFVFTSTEPYSKATQLPEWEKGEIAIKAAQTKYPSLRFSHTAHVYKGIQKEQDPVGATEIYAEDGIVGFVLTSDMETGYEECIELLADRNNVGVDEIVNALADDFDKPREDGDFWEFVLSANGWWMAVYTPPRK